MKVTVDQDACVASGQCVLVAPEVFDQHEDDGIVTLLTERPGAEVRDEVRQAVRICPARAVAVDES
ncbi:ferredoxin [Saccharopolyspora sp. K220]|uniref:ferredoxin n=1 Tax=Saccharopolyspora soli TaxID=2926618 RepID=UPI001F5AEEA0|nr:ferredoxin [Saccharopolyspora soli]MCI2423014.1 ferredoxin [Saccharopolyspora soli]